MRSAAAVLVAALAAFAAAPATARDALSRAAPDFPVDAAWVNAMPFSLQQLREKRVVLLAFINSANINSLRALKALEAWDEAWSLKGLMIIAVHSPVFEFQKDPAAVGSALRYYGAKFPVVLDNDGRISKAYVNDGWPAFYLIDGEGSIVYDHVGEDRYGELESEIRRALAELPDYGSLDGPVLEKNASLRDCGKITPEVSVSTDVKPARTGPGKRLMILSAEEGRLESTGRWKLSADGAVLAQANPELSASLRITYRGAQALAALTPGAAKHSVFFVKQDGLWLHSLNAGADVRLDDQGQSYVVVDVPRLYELAANQNEEADAHELELIPATRGAGIHQFSFSDRCLPLRP